MSLVGGGWLALNGLRRRHAWSALSLAALGGALMYRGVTGHSRAYRRIGIERPNGPIEVVQAVTVNRSPAEVYAFWRHLENLPRFMRHLRAVRQTSATQSHWVAEAMGTRIVEWDSEIVEDRPNELIRWRSLSPVVQHSGEVYFRPAPGGRGTEVHVRMDYRPPIGLAVAALVHPMNKQMLKEEIRRFKAVMEAGEVPTTQGQSSGRRAPMPRREGGAS
jgi:uncharacterized membrane protein